MSDVIENGADQQAEAIPDQEMAELMAGYNARGEASPPAADQAAEQSEVSTEEVSAGQEQVQADDQSEEPNSPNVLAARLDELKAEIRANASQNDPAAVRKLYGEVGNINRMLQEVKAALPQPAPVKDDLTAAMEDAERLAEEYPELAGPLVKALKETSKARPAQAAAPVIDEAAVSQSVEQRISDRIRAQAIEALEFDHPDYAQVIESEGFNKWIDSKPADRQALIRNTENPILASKFLTEFKESQRQQQQVQQQKQNRLVNAIAPRGQAAPPAKSKLTADEEVWAGYNKGAPRPIHKRS